MKNNVAKRIFAVVVALVLAVVMVLPAFAANDTYKITLKPQEGYAPTAAGQAANRFVAYQIFKGTVTKEDKTGSEREHDNELANITWGAAINSEDFLTELKEGENTSAALQEAFADVTTAQGAAKVLAKLAENAALLNEFAKIAEANLNKNALTGIYKSAAYSTTDGFVIEVPKDEAGYYLIIDELNTTGKTDEALSFHMLKVVNDSDISIKTDVPTVEKDIVNPSSNNSKGDDYGIGDTVTFKLTGTLPYNYADFDKYYYQFYDTLSAGLTYNANYNENNGFKVTIGVDGADITDKFVKEYNSETGVLKITCADLTEVAGLAANSEIVVTYQATLNSNAVMAGAANTNTVKVVYSNDPYSEGTGETTTKTVNVYTFDVEFTKTASDKESTNNGLEGAGFKLSRKDPSDSTKTQWAVFEEKTGADGKKVVTGKVLRWTNDEDEANEVTSGADGKFHMSGLDAGTYTLKETTTPNGYNTMKDATFTISTATENSPEEPYAQINGYDSDGNLVAATLTSSAEGVTVTGNKVTGGTTPGAFAAELENTRATTLPGTGGMGTTIFYTAGAVMLAVAVVFLAVSKVQKKSRD